MGKYYKSQDGAGNTLNGLTVLDRGYTGHEHLQSVGLINMNTRLYDPMLHRFLQADNFIQDPLNTQNYNQYGYVYNNPNKYADFSGNLTQKNIDPKNPTHPTELDEVIVSRRSPGGSHDMSYGPSLVPFSMPGITGATNGLGRFIDINYISYTSTHQTRKKNTFNSGVGDQLKIKFFLSLRTGTQGMFEVNDTFFQGIDEGRNYQFNLGEHNLNFRPKDYRLRFMAPSHNNTAQGVSIGKDGIGWHYSVRNGSGRSAGADIAFRPGGYTMLFIAGVVISILQPEAAPAIEKSAEEILIPWLAY